MVWPIMQGISDPEDWASSPSKIPAPNMVGTIPANGQAAVGCALRTATRLHLPDYNSSRRYRYEGGLLAGLPVGVHEQKSRL
jgi:hypothetical protein